MATPELAIAKRGSMGITKAKIFIENYSLSIDGIPVEISDLGNVVADTRVGKQTWMLVYDGHCIIETPAVEPFPVGLTVNQGQNQSNVDMDDFEGVEFTLDTGLGITYKGVGTLLNHTINSSAGVLNTRASGVLVAAGEPIRKQA